ncbi:MAG: M48 family metallopeptidase [Cyanobacteria bacterium]|nr:M48 family metallopeptidase [Cyanobacteriota bacterium]MDW8201281.1 M48 family metallopeptidase [Cyanobacteriota bacterium SKYGB_h_bin112]
MLNLFSRLFRCSSRRVGYGLLATITALGVWLGAMVKTPALPIGDLIFQGIQIIQLSNISDEQEVALGRQMDSAVMAREFRAYRNADINAYVNDIGQKLARLSDRPNLPYTFRVVDDQQVNAFATMGGYVYITTGLLRTADNEAQLAGVIGHEIGHITGRHLIEQMKNDAIYQTIATAAGVNRDQIAALGIDLALRRPRSREDEYDADRRGLQYMGRAGYAQSAMPVFMAKLQSSRSVPDFLSTHPAPADRVAAIRRNINPSMANGAGLDVNAYRRRIRPLVGG